jgi:transcriptional regulator with XRE-family HTH domain
MTADVSIRQAVVAKVAADGLSDREFARQLGVSHNWVHRHLRADPPAPFSADDLEMVAKALGVPMVDLLPAEPTPGGVR